MVNKHTTSPKTTVETKNIIDYVELQSKLKYLYHIDISELNKNITNLSHIFEKSLNYESLPYFFQSISSILCTTLRPYDFIIKQYLNVSINDINPNTPMDSPPFASQLLYSLYSHNIYDYFITSALQNDSSEMFPINPTKKCSECGGIFDNDTSVIKYINAPKKNHIASTDNNDLSLQNSNIYTNWSDTYARLNTHIDSLKSISHFSSALDYRYCEPTSADKHLSTTKFYHNWFALLVKQPSFCKLDDTLNKIYQNSKKDVNPSDVSYNKFYNIRKTYSDCYSNATMTNSKYKHTTNKIIFTYHTTKYLGFDFLETLIKLEENAGALTDHSLRNWTDIPNIDSVLCQIQNLPVTLRTNILSILACNYEARHSVNTFNATDFIKTIESLFIPLTKCISCYIFSFIDMQLCNAVPKISSFTTCYDICIEYFRTYNINGLLPFSVFLSGSSSKSLCSLALKTSKNSSRYVDYFEKTRFPDYAVTFSNALFASSESYINLHCTRSSMCFKFLLEYFRFTFLKQRAYEVEAGFFSSMSIDPSPLPRINGNETIEWRNPHISDSNNYPIISAHLTQISAQYLHLLHRYSITLPYEQYPAAYYEVHEVTRSNT